MATTLSYTLSDFQPFTKITASAFNTLRSDIKNRLNWDGSGTTTGLGDDNLQSNSVTGGGLTRSSKLKAGTANYVVINDSNGKLSEEAHLALSRGGTGLDLSSLTGQAGKGLIVNQAENALSFGTPTVDRLTQTPAADTPAITVGEAITANDAVCLDLHNGTGSNVFRVFRCNASLPNRRYNFIGFAASSVSVTNGVYTWVHNIDLVTGNTITYSINGRSYTTTYASSNDATMSALATQIATDPDVLSAAASGSPEHTITITGKGALSLNITGTTWTGGAGQPTVTITNTTPPVGGNATIRSFGDFTSMSGLVVGQNYFLDNSAGAITNTPSDSNPIFVGQALSTTCLFVNRNVGSYQFTTPVIFVRAHGGSGAENVANFQNTSEHFSFSSWSAGTSDTTSKSTSQTGDSSLGGYYVSVDGVNTSSAAVNETHKYNKSAWSAGSARTTSRNSGAICILSSKLHVAQGTTTIYGSAGATNLGDTYDGSSWTNSAFSFTSGTSMAVGGFTQGGKGHWMSGSGGDLHFTYDGASAAAATTSGLSTYITGGSASASSKGISGCTDGTNICKQWDGASWSSNITYPYTPRVDSSVASWGPATAYNSGTTISYCAGGQSSSSVSLTNVGQFNGSTWSSATASTSARSGAEGTVF